MTDHAKTAPKARAADIAQETAQARLGPLYLGALVLTGALALLPGMLAASDDTTTTQEPAELMDETSPDLKEAEEVEGDLAPDDKVEEGLDVDDVTEKAEVPEEDANPNPVVPQGGVIPPESIKEEADQ